MVWPCENCGTESAAERLFYVMRQAALAHRMDVVIKALDCANHDITFGGNLTLAQHCAYLQLAKDAAALNDWVACIEALDHAGGGGGGATASGGGGKKTPTKRTRKVGKTPKIIKKKKTPKKPPRPRPNPKAKGKKRKGRKKKR